MSAKREQGLITTPTKMPSKASQAANPNVSACLRNVVSEVTDVHSLFIEGLVDQRAGPDRGARDDDNVRSQSETQNCPTQKGKPFDKFKNNLHTHCFLSRSLAARSSSQNGRRRRPAQLLAEPQTHLPSGSATVHVPSRCDDDNSALYVPCSLVQLARVVVVRVILVDVVCVMLVLIARVVVHAVDTVFVAIFL